MNELINKISAKRGFKKLRSEFENIILVVRQTEHFRVFLAIFLVAQLSPKRSVLYTRIHSLNVNGVVTGSNHALWRDLSNIVIWLLGHFWVDTPHINTFEGDSVFKMTEFEAPIGTLLLNYKDIKHYCFLQIASLWSLSIWVRIHLEYQ